MPAPSNLADLLHKLAGGEMTLDQALQSLSGASAALAEIPGATVDLGREDRCGFAEVIYGEGKSPDLIARIAQTQLDANQVAMATRVEPSTVEQVSAQFKHTYHNAAARTLVISDQPIDAPAAIESDLDSTPHAAVITAGSTDRPVAEEAIETLAWMQIPFQRFDDIGVAGPQRLLAAVPKLRHASAVVVVAGMEGALPAAVAGHLSVPIFAVPTSVGYGTNLGGLTPLMGMLSSCAANVAAVNIDAGFKGGYLAGLVVHQLMQRDAS